MATPSNRKRKSAPPGLQLSSPAREAHLDPETEEGVSYSAVLPGEDHPDAASFASGGSLSFAGTPVDPDRPIQGEEQVLELQAPPWGNDVEDSRSRYPLPLFPAPRDKHTGEVTWTGKEEEDFKNSVKTHALSETMIEAHAEAVAEEMWQHRVQRKIEYWLHWSAARGAYLLLTGNSVARVAYQAQDELEGLELFSGDRSLLPNFSAFALAQLAKDKDGSSESESVSVVMGGGITRKDRQRPEDVEGGDQSTAGASWRDGKQRTR